MSRGCRQETLALKGAVYFAALLLCLIGASLSNPLPKGQEADSAAPDGESTTAVDVTDEFDGNSTNSTDSDLYVVRVVVYEIGILTDADNSTNDTTERHEEVNLKFIDPPHQADGILDLSGIPLPVLNTTEALANKTLEEKSVSDEHNSEAKQTS